MTSSYGDEAAKLRHEIIQEAMAAKSLDLPGMRLNAAAIIHKSLNCPNITEEEIFRIIYGEGSGSTYWRGWLSSDPILLYEFSEILEVHRAKERNYDDHVKFFNLAKERYAHLYECHKRFGLNCLLELQRGKVLQAFSVAARSGPEWMQGDLTPLLNGQKDQGSLCLITVVPPKAVDWLRSHPELHGVLPASLAKHVLNPRRKTGTPGREKKGIDLIEQELLRCAERGEGRKTIKDWSEYLVSWYLSNHGEVGLPTAKTVSNQLGAKMRSLGLVAEGADARPK